MEMISLPIEVVVVVVERLSPLTEPKLGVALPLLGPAIVPSRPTVRFIDWPGFNQAGVPGTEMVPLATLVVPVIVRLSVTLFEVTKPAFVTATAWERVLPTR